MSSSPSFSTKDIPDLPRKVIIVTGGNSGVGKECVLQLSRHNPAKLYMAARSKPKFDLAVSDILTANPTAQISFLQLDLSSFASIHLAATTILTSCNRLDILLNNAGIMAVPPSLTADGYEVQFGTNHLGHALFTKLLMPLLLATAEKHDADVRIVNVSSQAEMLAPKAAFVSATLKTEMSETHTYVRYAQSKLANVLFTRELSRRYPSVKCVAVHPGRVRTPLLDGFLEKKSLMGVVQGCLDLFIMVPVEKGGEAVLWTAVGGGVESGGFYGPGGKMMRGGGSKASRDVEVAGRLWAWQDEEFKTTGY